MTERPPLARGAGRGKVLFLDAFSGVAGDMTIAALLDLGVPREVIDEAVAGLPLTGYELTVGHDERSSIVGATFEVRVSEAQPHRTYREIDAMLTDAPLDEPSRVLARAMFRRLGEAEAAMHRMPLDEVHFHEVGAVDAIVDIVGAAAALSFLEAEVVASPLPMGHGFIRAQHGILPLPAPATVACLEGVPTYGVDLEGELVTPTGATIVATAATGFTRWPDLVPRRVGFGCGRRRWPDRPNLLRVVLGEAAEGGRMDYDHAVIEATIDDMTGELAGHALAAILHAGAVDAWATPATGKKGRPALVLAAIAPRHARRAVAECFLRETSTIGVRFCPIERLVRPRRIVEVLTVYGAIPLKVSEGPHGPPTIKPELDVCAAAAAAHDVPLRVVIDAALRAFPQGDAAPEAG